MKSFLPEFVQFLVTKLSLGYQILAWVQLQSGKLTYFTVLELSLVGIINREWALNLSPLPIKIRVHRPS